MFKLCNICYIIRSIKQAQATDSESVLDSVRPSRAELRVNAGPCHYDSDWHWQAVLLLALALAQAGSGNLKGSSTVTARAVTHAAAEVGGQGAVSGVGSPGQRLTSRPGQLTMPQPAAQRRNLNRRNLKGQGAERVGGGGPRRAGGRRRRTGGHRDWHRDCTPAVQVLRGLPGLPVAAGGPVTRPGAGPGYEYLDQVGCSLAGDTTASEH